ncbi:M23 family metallopeptidase [Streptomyces sp. NPDC058650]|uniref:M23 family metallopeptidase n=1 Tax=Streptomyces sp. NPDC058650 TaxID=3346575 RepID=UPI00364FF024
MVRLIKAARGGINTKHGEQIGRGFPHVGIDIGWGGGTELYAPADGYMTWSVAGTYGNLARIVHSDGSYSRIAHAAEWFKNGADVEQGEHIGTMGRTGGPWGTSEWFVHCHQEYWVGGRAVDPLAYMSATAGSGAVSGVDEMTDDERNALFSIYKALFFGGGDAGDQSLITRIVENQQNLRAIGPRVINLDQQVTGADKFDTRVGPSIAGRLIAIQRDGLRATVDLDALAAKIVAKLPAGADTAAIAKQVAASLAEIVPTAAQNGAAARAAIVK